MKPYAQDLRERVIAQLEAGDYGQAEIAELFGVHLSTVEKWWHRWRTTKSCAACPPGSGGGRTLAPHDELIRAKVQAEPDIRLDALCEYVKTEAACAASPSMMCRTLQVLGLPRKKKCEHDSQRDTPRVQKLRKTFTKTTVPSLCDVLKKLKFLDETGVNLGLTPRYGRAAPGERVVEATPGHSGTHYTVTAVLGWTGISAPWLFEGAMNANAFETYVAHVLCPTLCKGDIVVMDNLSAHKSGKIRELIEACGAQLEFLPPYSSDFNPIELAWAKVKEALRYAKARTEATLLAALAEALRAITDQDSQAWFKHCGYALP